MVEFIESLLLLLVAFLSILIVVGSDDILLNLLVYFGLDLKQVHIVLLLDLVPDFIYIHEVPSQLRVVFLLLRHNAKELKFMPWPDTSDFRRHRRQLRHYVCFFGVRPGRSPGFEDS